MSRKSLIKPGGNAQIAEIRMAITHGIEGLKRSTETDQYDDWLDFFEITLNELTEGNGAESGFPSQQSSLSVFDEGHEVDQIENLKEIVETAERIKERDIEERVSMEGEISRSVRLAEDFYEMLPE